MDFEATTRAKRKTFYRASEKVKLLSAGFFQGRNESLIFKEYHLTVWFRVGHDGFFGVGDGMDSVLEFAVRYDGESNKPCLWGFLAGLWFRKLFFRKEKQSGLQRNCKVIASFDPCIADLIFYVVGTKSIVAQWLCRI